jgi:outer membrane immunogenic protein
MNRFVIALLAGVAGVSLVSAASAADLIIDEPAPEVGVLDVGGNWDGLYVGGFAGWAGGDVDVTDGPEDIFDIDGWLIGAALGANFSLGNGIVAGVVGDIAWSDIGNDDFDFNVNWVGSLRGKLGFDAGAFLPYLTAGLAVAGTDWDGIENTHFGWTAGAGVEYAVSEELSVDLLYRYSDYGPQEYAGTDYEGQTHQVTVGLNWHF